MFISLLHSGNFSPNHRPARSRKNLDASTTIHEGPRPISLSLRAETFSSAHLEAQKEAPVVRRKRRLLLSVSLPLFLTLVVFFVTRLSCPSHCSFVACSFVARIRGDSFELDINFVYSLILDPDRWPALRRRRAERARAGRRARERRRTPRRQQSRGRGRRQSRPSRALGR